MKEMKFRLVGDAETKWEWMKEEYNLSSDELLIAMMSSFYKITKSTQGGKEPTVFRVK